MMCVRLHVYVCLMWVSRMYVLRAGENNEKGDEEKGDVMRNAGAKCNTIVRAYVSDVCVYEREGGKITNKRG